MPGGIATRIFAGSGEMARLVRERDWSKTPLGPVESWSQSLRSAVSICLGSRHPIVLWWGPERWMFYNDAYRVFLGDKHPRFLGGSGRECWAEIWDIIGPMMDQVVETGEATWSEDLFLLLERHGYKEETFYTFSYSPIRDDDGRVHGIFDACTETTERVLGARRMKVLRRMAVEARSATEAARLCAEILGSNARDVPFALVYLLDRSGERLHLAGHAGLAPALPASPLVVEMAERDGPGWPLARVAKQGRPELVADLNERFDCLPKEPWDEPANQAMLLPIARPGSANAAGVVVLGISPRRRFDDAYRGFFDLAASHVATAVSNAEAFQAERERAEKLAEIDRTKTRFFSNVSHEFRTPLTLILGPVEEALADPTEPLSPHHRTRLEMVRRNSLRMLQLVNTLLDFSRLEAGRMKARFEPTDLGRLSNDLASVFRSAIEKAGLTFTVDCPALPEPVYVDPNLWSKIVSNLLSNALKFTFAGGITLRLRDDGKTVEMIVEDTGTGIAAHELPKLFQRFHRVEGARGRTHEGSGIGLALVQELVKLHGGTVTVESVLDKGTTFVVTVPFGSAHLPVDQIATGSGTRDLPGQIIEAFADGDTEGRIDSSTTDRAAPLGERPRLLLVDDNADLRRYVAGLLRADYVVEEVVDGEAALEAVERARPDLIVSDVMMPRLDGFGLVRRLRESAATRAIPIILLSARAGAESAIEGLGVGADDYLVKPFSAAELRARARTQVEMARVRRELAQREVVEAELRHAIELREQFLTIASHELKTPLTSLQLQVGGMQRSVQKTEVLQGEQLTKRVNNIDRQVQRLARLIDQLLDVSLASAGQLRLDIADVDLGEVVREVATRMKDELRAAGCSLGTKIDASLIGKWDRLRLDLVVTNLLANAIKFGAGRPIEIAAIATDGGALLTVRDQGIGIGRQDQALIFERFGRAVSAANYGGFGLGLWIVKTFIEAMGGRVTVDSNLGQGATFTIGLPLVIRHDELLVH